MDTGVYIRVSSPKGRKTDSQRMKTPPPDLENVNDNLPVEHELGIVIAWAKQAGYVNVAAAVKRALIELEAGRKLAELDTRRK